MLQIPAQPRYVAQVPAIADNSLQLWLARLPDLPGCGDWLDDRERVRLQALSNPTAARHFTATRSFLRLILASQLACAPEQVRLTLGEHGKPQLENNRHWHFNLSHSGDWLALGLRRHAEVGVDIERQRPAVPIDRIAKRIFDEQQAAYFAAHPTDTQRFLQQWTGLEATQKCLGQGVFGERVAEDCAHTHWQPAPNYWGAVAWPEKKPPSDIDYLAPSTDFNFDMPESNRAC